MSIDLDTNEQILATVRRHWFALVGPVVGVVFFALLPFIILAVVRSLSLPFALELGGQVSTLAVFGYSAWLLLLWVFFFVTWTDYYLDVWYVTNKRIVDAEQKGLFHREVSSLHYGKIQDITVETRGLIATIFGFGDLHVQTAGEDREIVLRIAANPEKVKQIISNQTERESGMVQRVRMIPEADFEEGEKKN